MLVILDIINNEKLKYVCIAGDCNLDLLKEQTHTPASDFLSNFLTYSFTPVIHVPIRITDTTSTLIENIFINRHELPHNSAVVVSDISYHLPVVLHLPMKLSGISPSPSHQIPTRNYTPTNIQNFTTALGQMEWEDVKLYTDMKDTKSAYNCFHTAYKSYFDLCFPEKVVKHIKRSTPRREWMSSGLVKCCNKKLRLYKHYLKCSTQTRKLKYIEYQN